VHASINPQTHTHSLYLSLSISHWHMKISLGHFLLLKEVSLQSKIMIIFLIQTTKCSMISAKLLFLSQQAYIIDTVNILKRYAFARKKQPNKQKNMCANINVHTDETTWFIHILKPLPVLLQYSVSAKRTIDSFILQTLSNQMDCAHGHIQAKRKVLYNLYKLRYWQLIQTVSLKHF